MKFLFKSDLFAKRIFHGPLIAANEPQVNVVANTLTWAPVDAISIDVYRENGEFIESIPGNSTSWSATSRGGYFLVGADHGEWHTWGKSNIVHVYDEYPRQPVTN